MFEFHQTKSRVCALECDINLHKSNSTFFTDLDTSRAALLTRLFSHALRNLRDAGQAAPRANMILGATQCSFQREILPYQAYEVHSRVLCWDAKWIFIVSYFVKSGARLKLDMDSDQPAATPDNKKQRAQVFATAVSKYVVKEGKLTVSPERVLQAGGYLARPDEGASEEDQSINYAEEMRIKGLNLVRDCMR